MALILVIDDDAGMRRTLARILAKAGHEVVTAADDRAGLDRFRERRPAFVLVDIFMGASWGVDAIRQMRAADPAAKIVAISGSAFGKASVLDLARAAGADSVLAKPFHAEELLEIVGTARGEA